MKIVIIGDIHGRNNWLPLVEQNLKSADKIVFTGDYFDTYDKHVTFKQMKDVFYKIVKYKILEPYKFVLLIGNHDIHYIHDVQKATRYDFRNATEIKKMFRENEYLLQYAYQIKNHLFTHAGVANKWIDYNYDDLLDYDYEDIYNLGETINLMGMNRNGISILNQVGRSRRGFYDIGGPLWADVKETYKDIPDGLHQYVGHSQLKDFYKHSKGNSSITYCDVLGTIDKAMIINI